MPTYTTLHQDATTFFDATGTPKFRVASSITFVKEGDLPYAEVFVHEIVNSLDPKQDKFLRVATVHDLTIHLRGRDNAVVSGQTIYLASSFAMEFNDITTATSAKEVVRTRVDSLIADWIKYSTQFLVPTDFPLPAPEDTLVAAATNTYNTAKEARVTTEEELAAANAALAITQTAATGASADLAAAQAAYTDCAMVQSQMSALITAYSGVSGYKTVMNALAAAAHTAGWPPSSDAAFDAALAAADGAITAEAINVTPLLTSINNSMSTKCATLQAGITAAAVAKTTADTAVATAQTEQALAQAAATAAAAAETAALAALLVVCPDFDPNA